MVPSTVPFLVFERVLRPVGTATVFMTTCFGGRGLQRGAGVLSPCSSPANPTTCGLKVCGAGVSEGSQSPEAQFSGASAVPAIAAIAAHPPLTSSFLHSALSSPAPSTPSVQCHCPIAPRKEEKILTKEIPDERSRGTHDPGFGDVRSSARRGAGVGGQSQSRSHISSPGLMCFHLLGHHQQEFTVLASQLVFQKFPELTFTSNPLGHLEFGVEVVVGASHLADADPVLSLKGELQGAPAKAGGQVHDEAHHVRQDNDVHIPALVPPNCLVAFGLKCCHDHVHIIVSVPQHALLVGRHHGVGRQPLKNLLQGFPSEGVAVLEDVVESMEGTQLLTLLLMVNMQWWWLRWLW